MIDYFFLLRIEVTHISATILFAQPHVCEMLFLVVVVVFHIPHRSVARVCTNY